MPIMEKTVAVEMIAQPDWVLRSSNMLDDEMQQYLTLAMEQKFDAAIKAEDVTKFYEIIFHFLNINTLKADNKLYDEHFKEISGDEKLSLFVKNMNMEKSSPANTILMQINEVYTRILTKYVKLAIRTISNVSVSYLDPKSIHYMNSEAYVLFNIKSCDEYELWKISFNTDIALGCAIEYMANIEMKTGDIEDFKSFVKEYNRENQISRIRLGNFAIAQCDNVKDSKSVVSVIKDIIILNKIFNGRDKFNGRVLNDILQTLIDKKTFPFKLQFQ